MRWSRRLYRIVFSIFVISFILAGCQSRSDTSCGNINWVDTMFFNNIRYSMLYDNQVSAEMIGNQIGETSFKMDGHVCSDYQMKNGDATYLPVGTIIYEFKEYNPDFRVIADNKVYQVNKNPNAETMGELWDIEGKVEKISLISGIDGSHIGDFDEEVTSEVVLQLLTLPYVGFEKVYPDIKHESGVFLDIHLNDQTSFRTVYFPNANAFSSGTFATGRMKELIMSERTRIKAAAGM